MEVLLINILDFLDIWSIHYFQSFQAMELVDRPFQKGSWSFGVGLPRMACAFACETSAWNSESPPSICGPNLTKNEARVFEIYSNIIILSWHYYDKGWFTSIISCRITLHSAASSQ